MTFSDNALIINASGDWAATTVATDENGLALDLTGFTASIVDVTGDLGSAVIASIPDAAAGQVRLSITWQPGWSTELTRIGSARMILVNGGNESASFPFIVHLSRRSLVLKVPRGADMAFAGVWPDDRDGASFVGETLDVVNASATLAGLVSVVVTDAETRAYEIRVEGDLTVPLGDAGTLQLRRRIAGAQPRTTPPLSVSFQ
jgi:hypothetical protein